MAKIFNLRQARKNKARAAAKARADANAARFGATKADRDQRAAERDRDARRLEAHRRPGDEPEN